MMSSTMLLQMVWKNSRAGYALLLCAAVAGLSSCKLVKKNYSVVSDHVKPAVADNVTVESGGSLPSVAPAAGAAATGSKAVVVQAGDTLSAIAKRHGTTVPALCAANSIKPSTPIRVGQQLRLPSGAAGGSAPLGASVSARTASYVVKPGDTLSGIAAKHGVSTTALMRANNMTQQQANSIRAGQTLRIPAK